MGWSKWSSGNRYDSQSGHAIFIGQNSRKIIDFTLYQKACQICNFAEAKGTSINSHDCHKNWTEYIKSLECDGILNICINSPSKKYRVHHLITDDDTTMRSLLKKKERDFNKGKLPVN